MGDTPFCEKYKIRGENLHESLVGAEYLAMYNAQKLERELASLRAEKERAERERDLAIAHDRQPYPTAWAYEQVCKARDDWQQRAERAEAGRDAALKDAERYRWLRSCGDNIPTMGGQLMEGEQLDAAIDAARKGEQ